MGKSPLAAGGPRRSLNGKQLKNTAIGTPPRWGSRLIVGRTFLKLQWKLWPRRSLSWGIRRSLLISRASFLIQLKLNVTWLPGALLRPHPATQKARGAMEILPATVPRPILQLRRDLRFLVVPNPRLQSTSWEAMVPRTTSKKELPFYRKNALYVFCVTSSIRQARGAMRSSRQRTAARSAFSRSPFGGRATQLYAGEGSALLSPSDFSRAPPSFCSFTIKSSSVNGALLKLRFPKNVSPK